MACGLCAFPETGQERIARQRRQLRVGRSCNCRGRGRGWEERQSTGSAEVPPVRSHWPPCSSGKAMPGTGSCRRGSMRPCACTRALPHSLGVACHPAAFVGTPAACLRALLAMVHLVLPAFVAAGFANISAKTAEFACHLAASCHIGSRDAADLRAIHVKRNTTRHHLYILLLQAGCGAMVACGRARITSFDTGLKLIDCHGFTPRC